MISLDWKHFFDIMTTLNIEKITRDKLKQLRRDDQSYDDQLNRMMGEYIALEAFLPSPYDSIPKFLKLLSQIDDPGYKLYRLCMDNQ